jgi:predicted transcriptional regulator of viral defense system
MENRLEKKQSVLGDLSVRLLSYAQMKGKTIARIGDFTRVLGISKNQERNLLSRLAQSGFIIRLRRGVYLLPEKIPSGGSYNPGTAYILEKLFEDLEGRYQLCGPACFNFYGFDEQIPNMWHVYNNKISGTRSIAERSFVFIKVEERRLGSVEQVNTDSGSAFVYSSKLRSLVDAVKTGGGFKAFREPIEGYRSPVRTRILQTSLSTLRSGMETSLQSCA